MMLNERREYPLVIVGGGIGGLTAAIALERVGLPYLVLERAPGLREVGAGVGLWDNALRVLDHLRVGDDVRAISMPLAVAEVASSSGEVLAHSVIAEAVGSPDAVNSVVHRAELLAVLASHIPPERIRTGAACVDLRPRHDGVELLLHGAPPIMAGAVVGADGLHSVVRKRLLGDEVPRYSGQTCYRGIADFEVSEPSMIREVQGPGQRAAICPLSPTRAYWWAAINAPRAEKDDPDGRREALLALYADWPFGLPECIAATEGPILRNDLVDRPFSNVWGVGPITLLGDAAHPMLPNLGQGACSAIEDALVLARSIDTHGLGARAFRAYERERLPRTKTLVTESWRFGIPVVWTNQTAVWFRETLIRNTPPKVLADQIRRHTVYDVGGLR